MSTYEPCVLGGDGRCTVWSHTHTLDGCPPEPMEPDAATRGLHPCAGCGLDLDADDVHDRCDECEPDAADVEALAEVLSDHVTGYCFRDFDQARALLASDWLAAHDAQVRREHGEQIAQAIEVVSKRLADQAWELSRDPHELRGAQEMFAAKCFADAARIARQEQGS